MIAPSRSRVASGEREGEPREVADARLFLVGDESTYAGRYARVLDGGFMAGGMASETS